MADAVLNAADITAAGGATSATVSAEVSSRTSADASLTTRLSSEETGRASTAASLTARISQEEAARAAAGGTPYNDASLTTRVSNEESARASAGTSLTSRVSVEEVGRATAIASLSSRTSIEESARTSADSAESTARTSADTSLTARISQEESARAAAGGSGFNDTSITARVSNEETARAAGVTSLNTRVSGEESTRTSQATSLTTRVSGEEGTRATADTSLSTRVGGEESTRTSQATSLTARISVEESTRAASSGGGGGGSGEKIHPGWTAGLWYPATFRDVQNGAAPGDATGSSLRRLIPFVLPYDMTVAEVGLRVTTVSSGGVCKAAIYGSTAGSSGVVRKPTGAPVIATGDMSTTTATDVSSVLGTPVLLSAGTLYWMLVITSNAVAAFRTVTSASAVPLWQIGSTALADIMTGSGLPMYYTDTGYGFATISAGQAFTYGATANHGVVALKAQ